MVSNSFAYKKSAISVFQKWIDVIQPWNVYTKITLWNNIYLVVLKILGLYCNEILLQRTSDSIKCLLLYFLFNPIHFIYIKKTFNSQQIINPQQTISKHFIQQMGQTCQTCVASNFELLPQHTLGNQNLQLRLNTLRYELMKDQPEGQQKLKQHRINQNTVFLGRLNFSGLRQGYGELKSGDKFFAGNFINSLPQGKGVLVENDYFYYGQFAKGKPHGSGQQRNKQLQFNGDFINGHRNKGKLIHPQYIYQGQFKNNLFEGKGKINYTNQSVTYQGYFKNGKFHGEGLVTFRDKYKYEGEFKEGKYHGKGLILSQCGQIFQGYFENGTKNGRGWVKTTNGHEVFAQWKNCDLHGEGVIKIDGENVDVEWKNNRLVHDE